MILKDLERRIRFCTAVDGARIAYTTSGEGPPLLMATNALSHLRYNCSGPIWRHWVQELAHDHTVVRYDERGCGLSDWGASNFSIDAWVRDLEAVVEAMGLERFPLLGVSQGATIAVAYAARHRDKVSRLVLFGGCARGRLKRELTPRRKLQAETMLDVIRVGWAKENPAFRQLFATMMIPDGTEEQRRWLNELARITTPADNALAIERAYYHVDVSDLARRVTAPTLVLHSRGDFSIPFEEGRLLAALIPDARLVPLDSRNHVLLAGEPAWDRFLAESRAFLGVKGPDGANESSSGALFPELTPREQDVLRLVAQGESNEAIAQQLLIAPTTVRNHVSRIYRKLGAESRAQAIVLARNAGLGRGVRQSFPARFQTPRGSHPPGSSR
ncbi:MAG TPA: alpha/beta fold hydrolase [Candidatus Sulfomarinibacteraceae bacterium]|nr:alpha/beta fold hydrolase [Candidatus Sulfomarinibacteraceae bacterium]